MPRANLSLPHERRKAKLKSRQLALRVKRAEIAEQLKQVTAEVNAMKPQRKSPEE